MIGAAVKGGINHSLINAPPENDAGNCYQRLDEDPCVKFVNPIFVCDRSIKAMYRCRNSRGQFRLFVVQQESQKEPEDTRRDRDDQ